MHVCIFPGVKGLHNGIVLVVSILIAIMKDKVALLEEQMVDISLFAWYNCHGATLHLLIIHSHTVHMRTPNVAPLQVGQQLYTNQTLPFLCISGLARKTIEGPATTFGELYTQEGNQKFLIIVGLKISSPSDLNY